MSIPLPYPLFVFTVFVVIFLLDQARLSFLWTSPVRLPSTIDVFLPLL